MALQKSLHFPVLEFTTNPGLSSIIAQSFFRTPRARRPFECRSCYMRQQIGRRSLSTATEYRPYSLEPNAPPPRNANIPDTSIAGPQVELDRKRTSQLADQRKSTESALTPDPSAQTEERQTVIIPEIEAQKSKRIADLPPPSTTTATKPSRPSRLRSRKAAISLTPTAIAQLRDLLTKPDPKLIRVGVRNRGCSGLAYHLEYVDKSGSFDETVEQDGVRVLIDSKALFSIIGSEMDWVEDKLNQRFVFRNPNISKSLHPLRLNIWMENSS